MIQIHYCFLLFIIFMTIIIITIIITTIKIIIVARLFNKIILEGNTYKMVGIIDNNFKNYSNKEFGSCT